MGDQAVVVLHDILHGFKIHHGTGTAGIEAKLQQELASIWHLPLFQVYIDLRKAYNTIDRDRALETLSSYGMGPRLLNLLRHFWKSQRILVTHQSGFHGPEFQASRGGTQGSLWIPNLFNILIDNVFRYWLTLVIDDDGQASTSGLGPSVADKLTLFY
jgi:Reverse transcriptase (RNA-dependent DNA polymerase)